MMSRMVTAGIITSTSNEGLLCRIPADELLLAWLPGMSEFTPLKIDPGRRGCLPGSNRDGLLAWWWPIVDLVDLLRCVLHRLLGRFTAGEHLGQVGKDGFIHLDPGYDLALR